MNTQKNSQGFTLIELIVVILILGILSVVAAPRFISVQGDADRNVVADTAKKLSSAVDLFKIQWVANGHTGQTQNVAGFGNEIVDSNADGWPNRVTSQSTALNGNECSMLFNALLKDGGAGQAGSNSTWTAINASSTECRYTYTKDTTRFFVLDTTNGEVTVTNP